MERRLLIVNADDFGLSSGVNRGVIAAHEHGIVTSASLMVRGEAAAAAAEYARGGSRSTLDLGLHVDLGEWAWRDGCWVALYEVVPLDDTGAVENEIGRQVAAFRRLAGRDPTHLDSHQHVHRRDGVRAVVLRLANAMAIPLRHESRVAYCGEFYGQTAEGLPLPSLIHPGALCTLLSTLRPGITELACHPGFAEDLPTTYRSERALEVEALCDPRVRAALEREGIGLCRFSDVPGAGGRPGEP
jgi:predicted glycoside hydrolase/deacetylase ChbG (UPF0249 family)